jgi:hypothetical protein
VKNVKTIYGIFFNIATEIQKEYSIIFSDLHKPAVSLLSILFERKQALE